MRLKELFAALLTLSGFCSYAQIVPAPPTHETIYYKLPADTFPTEFLRSLTLEAKPSGFNPRISTNGYAHTPKGNLHMLIIFVLFTEGANNYDETGWPAKDVPSYVTSNKFILPHTNQLSDTENLTSWFHVMSYGNFTITGDVYKVFIKPTKSGGQYDFWQMYKQVFDSLIKQNPEINLKKYDIRRNNPLWEQDNSADTLIAADNIIDYCVLNFRLFDGPRWTGFSSNSLFSNFQVSDNYKHTMSLGAGHTAHFMSPDIEHQLDYFKHEFAHVLFDAPHYMGANNLAGKRFYANKGWGIMGETHKAINTTNAWESWWLGWLAPQEIVKDGTYQLKDFITERDALRIPIPGTNDVLWIENHQMKHAYDNKLFYKTESLMGKGIYAFITSRGNNRFNPHEFNAMNNLNTNAFKILHAQGNADFAFTDSAGNRFYKRLQENAISGQHELTLIRADFNNDNIIPVNTDWNNEVGFRNEHDGVLRENGRLTFAWSGHKEMAFSKGDEISRSGVSTITNYPIYHEQQCLLEPYIISPLSVEITGYDSVSGNYTITVHFNDVELRTNKSWTGNLLIKNMNGAQQKDLIILPGVNLTIQLGSTPTRHTKDSTTSLFCKTSILTLDSNTVTEIMQNGRIILKDKSTLSLENNASLLIKSKNCLSLSKGCIIKMKPGSSLSIYGDKITYKAYPNYILQRVAGKPKKKIPGSIIDHSVFGVN